jgi:hypothetical protein
MSHRSKVTINLVPRSPGFGSQILAQAIAQFVGFLSFLSYFLSFFF